MSKHPSSTSSSRDSGPSTWQGPIRPTRAVWLALALLLAVELGAARRDWLWKWVPRSHVGVLHAVEDLVIEAFPEPRVAVLGSSRARDAIMPRELEAHLGLATGTAQNLALTAGTPFDALTLYRRNRARLSSADILVVALEDWHFNGGFGVRERDQHYATLRERLAYHSGETRVRLLVGWAWRTYGAQRPLARFLESIYRGRGRPITLAEDGRIAWSSRRKDQRLGPERLADTQLEKGFYDDYVPSEAPILLVRRLAELAVEDGGRVLVVTLPWRDEYVEFVERHYADEFERYRRLTRDLVSEEGVDVKLYDRLSVDIPSIHFLDYGHMNVHGARRMTRLLADDLRDLLDDRDDLGVAAVGGEGS